MERNDYRSRVIDRRVEEYLSAFGAVCIEGPKWCGKTWTSAYHCKSEIMIGDPTGKLSKDLDIYIEAEGLTERGTFVINPKGEVVLYEVSAGNIGRNADELLRKVEAAQFVYEHGDEVCPAKWHPGEKTLKPSFDLVGKL